MGEAASRCWNSKPSPQIGIDCIKSGHGRVLEYPDVIIEISNYSARMIRELYTHTVGVTRLQASTRYIEYGEFDYYTPDSIKNNKEALIIYNNCMDVIKNCYSALQRINVKKEDIANILPLGMMTKVILKINVRALIYMSETRMCKRALKEYRNFMNELKNVVSNINDEWKLIAYCMKPKCKELQICLEKKSCGKYSNNFAEKLNEMYEQGRYDQQMEFINKGENDNEN